MRILIDMGHPADFHLFKNFMKIMERKGNEFCIIARDKDVTQRLLRDSGISFTNRGKGYTGAMKLLGVPAIDFQIYWIARRFKPDIFVGGTGNLYVAQVARLMRKPCYIFDDTEHAKFQLALMKPFATRIFTPECYKINLGKKQTRYKGHHELAYLHPSHFRPDPNVPESFGIKKGEKYFVLRFVSWEASHDKCQSGVGDKAKLVNALEKHGRVLISSEGDLPKAFERHRCSTSPEKMHSLLAYATVYVGEGATMAAEAATLGVPAIYVNTLSLGYTEELERYGLLFHITGESRILDKVNKLLSLKDLKNTFQKRKNALLKDKIDVTKFMVNSIGKK